MLSRAAGVLALNSLRVHSASVNIHHGSAINTFVVSPHFGSPPAAELLRQQLILALEGELDVMASLDKSRPRHRGTPWPRAGETPDGVPINRVSAPPRILWHDGASADQLVVEIRATDRAGLLAMLTGCSSAPASTSRGRRSPHWARRWWTRSASSCRRWPALMSPTSGTKLERDLYAVLPAPPPAKPVEAAG